MCSSAARDVIVQILVAWRVVAIIRPVFRSNPRAAGSGAPLRSRCRRRKRLCLSLGNSWREAPDMPGGKRPADSNLQSVSRGDPPAAFFIRCLVLHVSRTDLPRLVSLRRFPTLRSQAGCSAPREDHGHPPAVRGGTRERRTVRQPVDFLTGPSLTLFVVSPDSGPTVPPLELSLYATRSVRLFSPIQKTSMWVGGRRSKSVQ